MLATAGITYKGVLWSLIKVYRLCWFTINPACRQLHSVHTAYIARPCDVEDMDPTDVSDATAETEV